MSATAVSRTRAESPAPWPAPASSSAGGRRRHLRFDQRHRSIDEQAGRSHPRRARSCRRRIRGRAVTPAAFMRRAVGDDGMAVDPLEHHRPVADHGVEVGGGREALVRPQLLVPAAADDPARRPGWPRHKSRSRCCRSASELVPVRSSCSATSPSPMTWPCASIRPGSSVRPPPSMRRSNGMTGASGPRRTLHDLAVVVDQQGR